MFTPLKAPYRQGWLALTLFLLFTAPVFAQQFSGSGTRTIPYTVVYKLKQDQAGTRQATQHNTLQTALSQIRAKNVHQKFPNAGAAANIRRASRSGITQIYQATYSNNLSFEDVKRALMASGKVAYVEPLYIREPFLSTSDPFSDSTKTTAYYLKLIKAYGAWDVTKGDTNVVIGIADTGFRTDHVDLKGNIKYNYNDPVDGIDNDGDGYTDNYAGWDFADRDNNVIDDTRWKSHGMGVAGVAAAVPDNGTGIAGVGFKTKLLPLKVFSSFDNGSFGGYEAIVYAVEKGCKVINLSWGGESFSQFEQDIINYAVLDRDVVIVSAAGNAKRQANYYPASYANVLSVGGSDQKDQKYKDYTWSYHIDMLAPSVDIYSTTVNNTNSYGYNWGSSFASPMVAGAAALVRAQYPELNALQVMERLRMTTDDVSALSANQPFLEKIGTGRLNIKKALKQQNVKSVRSTAFGVKDNYSAQSGSTVAMEAAFLNILAPLSNLQVTLTSNSPYITIANGTITLGSMATLATANNHQTPFLITIAPDMPVNTTVAFRLGYSDGNYTDYQYFELVVNADYHTLDANNLHITINSKGNLGYNGLKFNQGVGVLYKGSSSMLFEGGLMIGTATDRVSDNLRNGSWQNDGDFTPAQPARIHFNTPLATQEIRGLMQDIYPSPGTVGVEVKHRALAWDTEHNQDYVIQEFTIKNLTPDTLKNVATALFADWDVGLYYQNAADWDPARNMGYVYNTTTAHPFVGIKLLTPNAPIYYAIDNTGTAGSVAVEDGFTTAEKYATLSGGVARTAAIGNGQGDNVSHVVGGLTPALAPGQSQTVSFAILSGDDLAALKQHADAAQQKYKLIKTGTAPQALQQTVCEGTSFTWAPTGGTKYNFYADPEKQQLLRTGTSFTISDFRQNTTIYATNADSLFESAVAMASLSLPVTPKADFKAAAVTIYANSPVLFEDKSINGANWRWTFGNNAASTEQNPIYTFPAPGDYYVSLQITDPSGCLQTDIKKFYRVREPLSSEKATMYAQLTDVFPNPSTGQVRINWAADATAGPAPEVWFTDQVGRRFNLPFIIRGPKEVEYDFTGLPNGLYVAHFTYKDTNFTKSVVLMR